MNQIEQPILNLATLGTQSVSTITVDDELLKLLSKPVRVEKK